MNALFAAALSIVSVTPALAPDGPATPAGAPAPAETSAPSPAAGAPADLPPPPSPSPTPTPPVARTITGTVRSIEIEPRRLVVEGTDGPATFVVDRNTAVYLDTGTGTLRDLRPGSPVRVSASEAGSTPHALWVEIVRPEGSSAAKPPAALTRPAGDAGAPSGDGASGNTSPPPVAPQLPPRAPAPSPPGPGPVPGGPTGSDTTTGTAPKQ